MVSGLDREEDITDYDWWMMMGYFRVTEQKRGGRKQIQEKILPRGALTGESSFIREQHVIDAFQHVAYSRSALEEPRCYYRVLGYGCRSPSEWGGNREPRISVSPGMN